MGDHHTDRTAKNVRLNSNDNTNEIVIEMSRGYEYENHIGNYQEC